ncbi:MAG: hypothetical protein ABSB35_25110 [Bryobacteraceae bacterium]|jgi:dipeptidyl aminopeptidase/acylaminoacyl peptidase
MHSAGRTVIKIRLVVFLISIVFTALSFSQTVSEKEGNIYFTGKDGHTVQITSSALDSDPNLSLDQRLVVFVRRTPSLTIDTGLGEADKNELWVAETSGKEGAHRVLVGHAGGFKSDESLVLAGFSSPQFSPDAKRIYFEAQTWATQASFRMVDVGSGRVSFLYAGLGLEVLQTGQYAGYLIALKNIPSVMGRIFRYWLLDQDGKDVGEIGGDPFNAQPVEEFKREHGERN